jgi:hypothetical protein
MQEGVASLRTYESPPDARARRKTSGPGAGYAMVEHAHGPMERVSLPQASLEQAEACYVKALALQPGLIEARLRLGRVRFLRGGAEAVADLGVSPRGVKDPGPIPAAVHRQTTSALDPGRAAASMRRRSALTEPTHG